MKEVKRMRRRWRRQKLAVRYVESVAPTKPVGLQSVSKSAPSDGAIPTSCFMHQIRKPPGVWESKSSNELEKLDLYKQNPMYVHIPRDDNVFGACVAKDP